MEQYISKSALVAEIDNRIKKYTLLQQKPEMSDLQEELQNKIDCLNSIKGYILNNLEVKEVDLKEERIKECPFKKVGCEIYEGHILECKGTCSWVLDHLKLKQLKAQKGE